MGNLMKADELSPSENSVSRLKAAIVLSFQNKKVRQFIIGFGSNHLKVQLQDSL
jgi:hypothetical protein